MLQYYRFIKKRSEFQLFMKVQTKEKIPVPHYYCELEPFMTALVLPVTKSGSLATIKELLRRFEDELVAKQYVEAYISVGKKASSLLEISLSYEEAMEVLNYCSFHDIRMVMSKEDLPKKICQRSRTAFSSRWKQKFISSGLLSRVTDQNLRI